MKTWLISPGEKRKILREDLLKKLLNVDESQDGQDLESLAQSLDATPTRTLQALDDLAALGQVEKKGGRYRLTPSGREAALNVVRAHRLWEEYLARETGFSRTEWHSRAEAAEHRISTQAAESLSEQLGYPAFDPHGDPIPSTGGRLPPVPGEPLDRLPVGTGGRIAHIEDEPADVYRQILEHGLEVGMNIFLAEAGRDRYLAWFEGDVVALKPEEAANLCIVPDPEWNFEEQLPGERLSSLEPGEAGVVCGLSPRLRGTERRRLMDLGVIPGTRILAEFTSPSGDPVAFRVRGALLALRQDQADHIRIRRTKEVPA